ncbi:ABC transporter permease [Paenibacillaceae bacterium]|nr:ABC transporter permease [Paenibacillaceae bacterium]
MTNLWNRNKFRFIVPVAVFIVWEIISRSGLFPSALFPAPTKVIAVMVDWIFGTNGSAEVNSGFWIRDVLNSGMRVMLGFAIAVVAGITLGVAIGWSRIAEKMLEPTIQMLRPIPPVSWIPLAIIWFGIANKPAIFLVFLGSFFPIVVNTIQGVKTTDKTLIRAASMMGANGWKLIRHVIMPAALPTIFTGLRLGIGIAWALTVTAEMVAVKSGLGYVLWDSYYFLRYDLVMASMASIGLMGFLMDFLIKKWMDKVLHWQRNTSVQGMK